MPRVWYESLGTVLTYIRPVAEIGIMAWLFYRFYEAVALTKASHMLRLALYYLAFFAVCYVLRFSTILWVLRQLFAPYLVFLFLLYQPELRRSFAQGKSLYSRRFRMGTMTNGDQIDSILTACEVLTSKRRGALIVFPRRLAIRSIIESGTRLNADLSSALILTVFDHDTPLHDGAMIIQGDRIVAAGCYLPLSEQTDIRKSFGTRHRAALGLAEESDAVVIVVSEETGAISLTYNANLYYDLKAPTVKRMLLALFSYQDVTPEELIEEASIDEAE